MSGSGGVRVQVLSDLHTDAGHLKKIVACPDADVVVVAGDVCAGCDNGFGLLRDLFPEKPIVTVAGNHEFYGRDIDGERIEAAERARARDIRFLDDAAVEIGGVRFVGATLWTDYSLDRTAPQAVAMRIANSGMNDHRAIAKGRRLFRPEDALTLHLGSRRFLDAELAAPFAGPTIVVTHHAPHPGSIAARYRVAGSTMADACQLIAGVRDRIDDCLVELQRVLT